MKPEVIERNDNNGEERAALAVQVKAMKLVKLTTVLKGYCAMIKPVILQQQPTFDSEIADIQKQERGAYPDMTLFEEMAAGRILEEGSEKDKKRAGACLLNSHLRLIWSIARCFSWAASNRMSREDFYMAGCSKMTLSLKTWDWQRSRFGTYINKGIHQEMFQEARQDRGVSYLIDRKILTLKRVRELWEQIHGETADNQSLAQAMVIYSAQPGTKLSEGQTALRQDLLDLGGRLGVFSTNDGRARSYEEQIRLAGERLGFVDELDRLSQPLEGDKPLDGQEEEIEITLLDRLATQDKYFRIDPEKLEEIIGRITATLTSRQSQVVKLRLSGVYAGRTLSYKEIGTIMGVSGQRAEAALKLALKLAIKRHPEYTEELRLLLGASPVEYN